MDLECRDITITLVSAESLPNVRNHGQMKVYAQVSIKGRKKTIQKTPTDKQGETNPRWNFPIKYTVSDSSVHQPRIELEIKLMCQRTSGPNKYVGVVIVPLKSLFDKGMKADGALSYEVGGTPEGRLNILYNFGEKVLVRKAVPSGSGSGWKTALQAGAVLINGTLILLGLDLDLDLGLDFDLGEDDGDLVDDENYVCEN